MNPYEQYMNEMVKGMRTELTEHGFEELQTKEAVENHFNKVSENETTFVMINSVCGCAGGLARPSANTVYSQNPTKPDNAVTVFAGQDKDATETMREKIQQAPSSPSMALFKGEQLVHFIPREHIEGRDIQELCMDIKYAFDEHC